MFFRKRRYSYRAGGGLQAVSWTGPFERKIDGSCWRSKAVLGLELW